MRKRKYYIILFRIHLDLLANYLSNIHQIVSGDVVQKDQSSLVDFFIVGSGLKRVLKKFVSGLRHMLEVHPQHNIVSTLVSF